MQKEIDVANLKAVKYYIYMALVVIFSRFEVAGQDVISNRDVVEAVYTHVLDSLLTESPEYDLELSKINGDYQAFLRSGWIRFWTGKQELAADDSVGFILVVDRFGAIVTYHEDLKKLTGFSEKLKRQIDMDFQGWIISKSDSKVINSFSIQKYHNDLVSRKQLDKIEKSPYKFTQGSMVTKSIWTRYLEPLIIVSAVSTIIYLFFNVRI